MEPLVIKKDALRYYVSVVVGFALFGALGGFVLYGGYLFWPLMILMMLFIVFTVWMKDGRYFEFYSDRLVIASDIPFSGRKEIKIIEYSNLDDISIKGPKDGPGGIGIKLSLKTGEKYLLNTGFMPQAKIDRAIELVKQSIL